MTVTLKTGALIGTDETTGQNITGGTTFTGSEVDLFGNATSEGWLRLYLKYTDASSAGTIDVSLFFSRVTGQSYQDQSSLVASIVPVASTQKIYLGDFQASRYVTGKVSSNGGGNLTNVTLGYELYQES